MMFLDLHSSDPTGSVCSELPNMDLTPFDKPAPTANTQKSEPQPTANLTPLAGTCHFLMNLLLCRDIGSDGTPEYEGEKNWKNEKRQMIMDGGPDADAKQS